MQEHDWRSRGGLTIKKVAQAIEAASCLVGRVERSGVTLLHCSSIPKPRPFRVPPIKILDVTEDLPVELGMIGAKLVQQSCQFLGGIRHPLSPVPCSPERPRCAEPAKSFFG